MTQHPTTRQRPAARRSHGPSPRAVSTQRAVPIRRPARPGPLPAELSPRRPATGPVGARRTGGRPSRLLVLLLGAALAAGLGAWQLDRYRADHGSLTAPVRAAGDAAGGEIEVAVVGPGGTVAESSGASSPVYTASLVKLLVVEQLLEGAAEDGLPLDAADRRDLERAVTISDDQAMNRLWVAFDGARLVRSAVVEFGLEQTAPPAVPGQWGQATASAADMARFLTALPAHLAPDDLAALSGWMRAASTQAADGFDQGFGLRSAGVGAPEGTAVKQGWMCCVDGHRQLHSAGLLPDGTAVVLLGEFPEEVPWDTARSALDAAARGVVEGLLPALAAG
ncbi:hypothetical protein SAMN05660662_3993 [Blastococcus aurantiacus]|uniref:Beta-lactamase enzyme family protein n=1 Tax=Blastococcus aurantiacus TaxID=1550231 RepID=A0A1G7QIP2_9ACTN|nr:hypothetical protein [Blastococcus aurantiacus]SDF97490.1 hypothetical protein SAMN05660662_3993 [Blastococcus aurantiacus]